MRNVWPFLRENASWLSAGMLLTGLSSFGQTFFIALFAADIQQAFNLSHGQWGGMYTIGTTASALVMVWAGRQADIFRVRTLGALSLSALALACLFMAFNPWVILLPVVIFALRFTGQGMMSHIAAVAMARWFVATRGRALSISALGFSIGQAVFPIAVVAALAYLDWHLIWVICAGVAALGVPVLLHLLKTERTPASIAKQTEALGMQGRHWARAEVLRHPLFWFMVPALIGPSAFNTAFFFHQVHFAEVIGITSMQFVAYLPLYTGITIASMLISGALLDKFGTPRLLPFHQVPMIFAFLIFTSSSGALGLGFVLLALCAGAQATLVPAFWAEFYGTAYIGAIKAMATAVMVFGSAIGPGLTGALIDFGIGIETQYFWIAIYFGLTTLSMWMGIVLARRTLTRAA